MFYVPTFSVKRLYSVFFRYNCRLTTVDFSAWHRQQSLAMNLKTTRPHARHIACLPSRPYHISHRTDERTGGNADENSDLIISRPLHGRFARRTISHSTIRDGVHQQQKRRVGGVEVRGLE